MGVSLGLVGLGSMGGGLAPIFYGHTEVSRVGICDVEPDRLKKFAENESGRTSSIQETSIRRLKISARATWMPW